MSRRASYVTMVVGALIAWADIDTERMAATTFGLILLIGGAVVAAMAHLLERRADPTRTTSLETVVVPAADVAVAADGV